MKYIKVHLEVTNIYASYRLSALICLFRALLFDFSYLYEFCLGHLENVVFDKGQVDKNFDHRCCFQMLFLLPQVPSLTALHVGIAQLWPTETPNNTIKSWNGSSLSCLLISS